MLRFAFCIAALACVAPAVGRAQPRLPTVPPAAYDTEQKKAAEDFAAARKQPPFGPFEPEMYSPRVMTPARELGDYLRFGAAIGTTLSELEILIVAREWRQDYEWSFHAPIALKQGIAQSMIDAVAAGRRPAVLTADEAIIYDFTIELLRDKQVSDPVYARARSRFGDKGVVDIVGLAGYYTLQAMILNVARTPAVAGAPTLPK